MSCRISLVYKSILSFFIICIVVWWVAIAGAACKNLPYLVFAQSVFNQVMNDPKHSQRCTSFFSSLPCNFLQLERISAKNTNTQQSKSTSHLDSRTRGRDNILEHFNIGKSAARFNLTVFLLPFKSVPSLARPLKSHKNKQSLCYTGACHVRHDGWVTPLWASSGCCKSCSFKKSNPLKHN